MASPERSRQGSTGFNKALIGAYTVPQVLKRIPMSEVRKLDSHHLLHRETPKTLVHIPYPAGFERDHRTDLYLLTHNNRKYPQAVEELIAHDTPIQSLMQLRESMRKDNRHNSYEILSIILARRAVLGCMSYAEDIPLEDQRQPMPPEDPHDRELVE